MKLIKGDSRYVIRLWIKSGDSRYISKQKPYTSASYDLANREFKRLVEQKGIDNAVLELVSISRTTYKAETLKEYYNNIIIDYTNVSNK